MSYMSPLLGEALTPKGILGASSLSLACQEVVNVQAAQIAGRDTEAIKDRSIWVEAGAHQFFLAWSKQLLVV